ncbi:hypothetical protein HYT02_03740 [Candidatus Gottesmanbacteria bacterium]|nr:hypothetical protein [Candidatus Gottesmanbacteria bacterium]
MNLKKIIINLFIVIVGLIIAAIILFFGYYFIYPQLKIFLLKSQVYSLHNFEDQKLGYNSEVSDFDWWMTGNVKNKGKLIFDGVDIPLDINNENTTTSLTRIGECEIYPEKTWLYINQLETPVKGVQDIIDKYDKILEEVKRRDLCGTVNPQPSINTN